MIAGQTYVESASVPALAGLVRTVWVQRVGRQPYVQRNLPTGGAELHCPIGDVPSLVGPLTRARVEILPAGTTLVGVRFRPGAATPMSGMPADELVDLTVRLDELWGSAAIELGELLSCAAAPGSAVVVLQRNLARRHAGLAPPDPLVAEAVRRLMPWRCADVAALARQLAISSSQLRRRCLAALGIRPKTLQRTLRFQGYLALAQAHSEGTELPSPLADLAAEVGYADQAHLSRECLRLTGLAPRELLGGKADRCDCGHDHSASYRPFLAGRSRVARRAG